jgi:hypothetical protein
MSVQKIASEAKLRIDEIEARYPRFWTDLGVNDVVVILRIVSEAFNSINQLARECTDVDESRLLTHEQLNNIMGLFSELQDNFFPMAHTDAPLGALKIINAVRSRELWSLQEEISLRLFQRVDYISSLYDQARAESQDLRHINEEMNRVLNP